MPKLGDGKKPVVYDDPCVDWLLKLSKAALVDFDRFSSSMASARQSIERFTLQVSGEARKIETILQKQFSKFQIELAGKEFYRKAGKTIPGSNRTRRLRKKRRKAIEAAGRNESLVNIRWNPIIAHPLCNPIRRLI